MTAQILLIRKIILLFPPLFYNGNYGKIFVKYQDFVMILYRISGFYQDWLSNIRTYQDFVDTLI